MNDQNDQSRSLIPRQPDAILPADDTPSTLVKTAKRALPVAGGALLMWAGRRALDALSAYAKRRTSTPDDIEIHIPQRGRQPAPETRIVKRDADQTTPESGYTVEYRYAARWSVTFRPKDRD